MANQVFNICVLPGDGIGPEVTDAACRVLDALAGKSGGPSFRFERQPAGHGTYLKIGTALPDSTIEAAKSADSVLLGAMDAAQIPAGVAEPLTQLRNAFSVNASVRPARSLPNDTSDKRIDVMVVREVTEGIYSGVEYRTGKDAACAVRIITREASTKVSKVAFEMARQRRRKVTAVHKIGVLKVTDGLFIECAKAVAADFPDVEFETRNVDACALELIREPGHFDVVLSTNAFGDILSDVAIGLGAGLGLAPSGCIGDRWSDFEPVHGTAPDIAGKGIANPIATILSAAMMLRHLGEAAAADAVEAAVQTVLEKGEVRTGDLGGKAGTVQMTDAIIAALA